MPDPSNQKEGRFCYDCGHRLQQLNSNNPQLQAQMNSQGMAENMGCHPSKHAHKP